MRLTALALASAALFAAGFMTTASAAPAAQSPIAINSVTGAGKLLLVDYRDRDRYHRHCRLVQECHHQNYWPHRRICHMERRCG